MGRIELRHRPDLFPITPDPHGTAVNRTFLLVLVDHITKIAISEKIHIDHPVIIRHIILFLPGNLFHIIVQDRNPVFIMNIFIYEEITTDLSGYFKV